MMVGPGARPVGNHWAKLFVYVCSHVNSVCCSDPPDVSLSKLFSRYWARMFGGVSSRVQRDRERAGGLGSVQQAVQYLNQDFQALKEECLQNGSLFQDPMFPAEPPSLGFKELGPFTAKTKGVEWKRPTVRTRTQVSGPDL